MTLECGQHDDPAAPEVGYRAIVNTLAHLGLIDAADPAPAPQMEALRLSEVVDTAARRRRVREDVAAASIRSPPASASARATTAAAVVAPFDGVIVFPNPGAEAGHEWFYLARPSQRFAGTR